jgi:hypothetical protein
MRIRVFGGGLNTRVDSQLIAENEATHFENIDSDTAILTPIKDKTKIPKVTVNRYSYYDTLTGTWLSESTPTDWVEYQEVIYKSDRINTPVKLVGTTEYQLGIDPPVSGPIVSPTSAPEALSRVTLTPSAASGDLLEGNYQYKFLNKSSTTDLISFSYYRIPIEEVTTEPFPRAGASNTEIARITSAAERYGTYQGEAVTGGSNTVTITFPDTNADQVRAYRFFDNVWRALTSDFQDSATSVVDDTYDISANDELAESLLVNGIVQYAITYYSTITNSESKPVVSNEIAVINGHVELTSIPTSSDPQVDEVRIYRIGGDLTVFTYVDSISNGTSDYTDTSSNTELAGDLLESQDYDVAPRGLKFLTESYAMLFGALDDKLRFTPIGKPDAWPSTFFLDFPEAITGISKTSIGLLIHTLYKTYLVTGTGPTSFAQQILSGDQGCLSHDSIQETKDTALWVSSDGICASDGSDVQVLTRNKLGKKHINVVNSVLYDQVYQVLNTDGEVLALDFDRSILKTFTYGVDYLVIAEDVLYGHNDGFLYSLNTSNDSLSMTWRSPEFVGPAMTAPKIYSSITFYSEGDITLSAYVDGELVGTQTESKTGLYQMKTASKSRRGSYISFEVTGTGKLRELAWDEGAANG